MHNEECIMHNEGGKLNKKAVGNVFFIRKIADRNVFFVVKIAFLSAFSFLLHLLTRGVE